MPSIIYTVDFHQRPRSQPPHPILASHPKRPAHLPPHARYTISNHPLCNGHLLPFEFPLLPSGKFKLAVPVFTVWGACEDVQILEHFRLGTCAIDNLHVIDEAATRCIDGVKLLILGLGGAFVPHKMLDNGDGNGRIVGGQGTMWTTALQMGKVVDTAQRVYDATETRVLVTHARPS